MSNVNISGNNDSICDVIQVIKNKISDAELQITEIKQYIRGLTESMEILERYKTGW